MFKEYEKQTQKAKVIQILLHKNGFVKPTECIEYRDIFVGWKAGSRLSELIKAGIVEVEYYNNPHSIITQNKALLGYHCAKYKLSDEAKDFYSKLYNVSYDLRDKLNGFLHKLQNN